MATKNKKVDYRFKILYAVAIIMVCCGHAGGGGISILSDWFPFDGIHLALFMFASGYFYSAKSEANIKQYIKKKIKKLIVPLYIYILAYCVVVEILRLKGFTIGGDFSIYNVVFAPFDSSVLTHYTMGLVCSPFIYGGSI